MLTHILLENVGGSEQNRSVIANVQSDDLWLSRMHAATHILQEKTRACGVLKRHNFQVHVSLGSAETLVGRGGIINHHSIAYSLSNISAKNCRNRLMWVESIVCNISVVFLRHSVYSGSALRQRLKRLMLVTDMMKSPTTPDCRPRKAEAPRSPKLVRVPGLTKAAVSAEL